MPAFSKKRNRLLQGDVARQLFGETVRKVKQRRLISSRHFSVEGAIVKMWACKKSLRPAQENSGDVDPKGSAQIGNEISAGSSDRMRRMSRRPTQKGR